MECRSSNVVSGIKDMLKHIQLEAIHKAKEMLNVKTMTYEHRNKFVGYYFLMFHAKQSHPGQTESYHETFSSILLLTAI